MKTIKKLITTLITVLFAAALFAGCSEKPPVTPTPSESAAPASVYDSADDFLAAVIETFGEDYPVSDTLDLIGNENISNYLGLTAAEISEYVQQAYVSTALMMTSPHQIAVIKLKDAAQAQAAAAAMASGFDPHKWICVIPELCETVISGEYVFLVAGKLSVEAAIAELTGAEPQVDVFYTKEGDTGGGISFGGDEELLPAE
ncbi:MAG: hypothetical protein LBO63_06605 [Oscillospiraceae bacterium]|jgi:hypothetical protein|nr:hypothetical protein [Oscillospiraceae bacterium]